MKFRIREAEGLFLLCSENIGTDHVQLICAFVFAYAKRRFSHNAAENLNTAHYPVKPEYPWFHLGVYMGQLPFVFQFKIR